MAIRWQVFDDEHNPISDRYEVSTDRVPELVEQIARLEAERDAANAIADSRWKSLQAQAERERALRDALKALILRFAPTTTEDWSALHTARSLFDA